MPMHLYIFIPDGQLWPASSVNARIGKVVVTGPDGRPVLDREGKSKKVTATAWLDRERPVEQMTWAPGEPRVIANRIIKEGGWIDRIGCNCFNLYRPPLPSSGDPANIGKWLNHLQAIFPAEAEHIIRWLAHRIQCPEEKINHALVLGGAQGIGKDTILEPVKKGVGPWNFQEVSPQQVLGRFNGFLKSVILRVSEARDLGDADRFAFYDHMKTYTAAPPDVLRIDEKHLREYSVCNVCGVIITTNHKSDGIHLPADDRRHFVAWSDSTNDDFPQDYWKELYRWYESEGTANVVAFLRGLDLSSFDPKSPPPKTEAFWSIVNANRPPENAELAHAIERLGNPPATTIEAIRANASDSLKDWINDRRSRRIIPHRLEDCGYVSVRNPNAKDSLWKLPNGRAVIYARRELPPRDQIIEAEHLITNAVRWTHGE